MPILRRIWLMMGVVLSPGMAAEVGLPSATAQGLGFRAEKPGLFSFDTGLLQGRLKMDGRYQGLYPIVEKASGTELSMPPGLLSPYRVFSREVRYGDAARDWPTSARLRPDGAVEVHWPAQSEHPLEMKACYRWIAPDTLDFQIHVTPQKDMPDFELFLSSYLTKGFRAAVYVQPKEADQGSGAKSAGPSASSPKATALAKQKQKGRFVPVDRPREAQSGYVIYSRDDEALRMIQDGRWKIPPSPVDWDIGPPLAKPICLRRDMDLGITVVLMSPADDCFAVASPWNQDTLEVEGYRSLYLSLFGRDLKAGQSATARCRLIIARNMKEEQILEIYEKYTKEIK